MKALKSTSINFGLVSFPVQICNGSNARADVKFKQVGPNGEALKQQYVDPQGNVVVRDDFKKGYEVSKGKIVTLDPESVTAIDEATKLGKDGLDVTFVDKAEVVERMDRIKSRYFIQPTDATPLKSYRLFADALAESGRAAVSKWCPKTRQELLVMWVNDEGILVAASMEFANECNAADEKVKAHLADDVTAANEAENSMAKQMMEAMTTTGFDALDAPVDEAIAKRLELVQKAAAGEKIEAPVESVSDDSAPDLSAALEASLAAIKSRDAAVA